MPARSSGGFDDPSRRICRTRDARWVSWPDAHLPRVGVRAGFLPCVPSLRRTPRDATLRALRGLARVGLFASIRRRGGGNVGSFFWCFRRESEGQFRAIPARSTNRSFVARLPFKPDDDGRVRLVFIGGPLPEEPGSHIAVDTVHFSSIEVTRKGFHTEKLRLQSMDEAMNVLNAHDTKELSRTGNEAANEAQPQRPRVRDLRERGVLVGLSGVREEAMDARRRRSPLDATSRRSKSIDGRLAVGSLERQHVAELNAGPCGAPQPGVHRGVWRNRYVGVRLGLVA